ncbi:uncharacterized protein LOC119383955 [Rhipicephalus sanguineus]|uniref:uncharacterized protein LOC119383955 n=1 Tax=Rhipicephalus sanguineus TaxID=34632 RepID=UPI001892D90B|nr:uncharacterized protein LOC119383955 [Rhipicephalus sanguineus]
MTRTFGKAAAMSDEEGTSISTTTNASELKLPHFWRKNRRVWFSKVEARFQLRRITSQESKYLHVVAALPPAIADAVDDVLVSTPSDKAYDELKTTVLKRLEVPGQSRLQQLMSHEELGDQRPSQLLDRMSQLLGQQASEERQQPLLHELFLHRLPQSTRMILAGSDDMTLERLAQLADRITDCTEPSKMSVAAAGRSEHADRLGCLEDRVDRLAAAVENLALSNKHRLHGIVRRPMLEARSSAATQARQSRASAGITAVSESEPLAAPNHARGRETRRPVANGGMRHGPSLKPPLLRCRPHHRHTPLCQYRS